MRNFTFKLFLIIFTGACVDEFEIPPKDEILYDPFGNLGFENGFNHWFGSSSMYSRITIDTDSYEGEYSLKLSTDADTALNENSLHPYGSEISKYMDVSQGDTVEIEFRLKYEETFNYEQSCLLSFHKFHGSDGDFIHHEIDSVCTENQGWNLVTVNYPVPQNAVNIEFGVRLTGNSRGASVLLDDFSIVVINLNNQNPSNVDLLFPSDNSSLSDQENVVLTWSEATDGDDLTVTYKLNLWAETTVENYLVNSDFENVVTHWLGDEIPAEWDYWPYYYHNVFSYPQLGDSLFNPKYIRSGTFSMSITGDFTGQSNKTILYQGFYANYIPPGTKVTFGGYMLNPSHDKIKNSNQAYFSIDQFFSSSGFVNNSTLLLNHTSESITRNHPLDEWQYFEVSTTTQENTNYLQMRINFEQFNDDSGTVFVDDLSITTDNNILMLLEIRNIDSTFIPVERDVFTEPYDFHDRASVIYYWDVHAEDEFSSSASNNGPFRLELVQ